MKPINKVLEINRLLKNPFIAYPQFSETERMVGKLAMMDNISYREIAEMTGIAHGTVIYYMGRICQTVGCQKNELLREVFLKELKRILDEN